MTEIAQPCVNPVKTEALVMPFGGAMQAVAASNLLYRCRVRNSTKFVVRVYVLFQTFTDSPTAGVWGTGSESEQVTRYLAPGQGCDFGERPTPDIDPASIRRHITSVWADDGFESKRRTDIDLPGSSWPLKNYCEFEIYEDVNMNLCIRKLTPAEETIGLPFTGPSYTSKPPADLLYSCRVLNKTGLNVRVTVLFRTTTDHPLGTSLKAMQHGEEIERVERTLAPNEALDFGERRTAAIDPSSIRRHITSIWADDGFETKRRTDVDIPSGSWPIKNFCEFEIYEDYNNNLRIKKKATSAA